MPRVSWTDLNTRIENCQRCERLTTHCRKIAEVKKRAYRDWDYWGRPVSGFGDPGARLWIVGLAPGAHGANRTGRIFTGDSSGKWLYGALHGVGLANQKDSIHREDGLILKDVYISCAARCAPPDNKPRPEELAACEPFLDAEFDLLRGKKLTLVLGAIAFTAYVKLLGRQGCKAPKPKPRFAHGAFFEWGKERVLCSYHPSQQNTQTGRLTPLMWREIFERAKRGMA